MVDFGYICKGTCKYCKNSIVKSPYCLSKKLYDKLSNDLKYSNTQRPIEENHRSPLNAIIQPST